MYSDVCDTTRRNHESRTPELSFGHNFYPFDRFVLILGYVVGGSKTKRLMCAVLREYTTGLPRNHTVTLTVECIQLHATPDTTLFLLGSNKYGTSPALPCFTYGTRHSLPS
jgi:hypothetical protein